MTTKGIEHRRCGIEWLDKKTVKITTPFKQKIFCLEPDDNYRQINLITLEKVDGISDNRFFAEIRAYKDEECSLKVYCKTGTDSTDYIDENNCSSKNSVYDVNIFMEK